MCETTYSEHWNPVERMQAQHDHDMERMQALVDLQKKELLKRAKVIGKMREMLEECKDYTSRTGNELLDFEIGEILKATEGGDANE